MNRMKTFAVVAMLLVVGTAAWVLFDGGAPSGQSLVDAGKSQFETWSKPTVMQDAAGGWRNVKREFRNVSPHVTTGMGESVRFSYLGRITFEQAIAITKPHPEEGSAAADRDFVAWAREANGRIETTNEKTWSPGSYSMGFKDGRWEDPLQSMADAPAN